MELAIAGIAGFLLALFFRRGTIGKVQNQAADAEGTWEPGVPNNDEAEVLEDASTDEGFDPGVNSFQTQAIIAEGISQADPQIGPAALHYSRGTQNVYEEPGAPTIGSLAAFTGALPVMKTDPGAVPATDVYIE